MNSKGYFGDELREGSIILTLDELSTKEIPDSLWNNEELEELTIQKTRANMQWSTRSPLSWYETVEFTPPYRELSDKVGKLKRLKSLILVDLDIKTLPESITQLKHLEILNLSFNKLELPEELSKLKVLKSLKHLILIGNHYDPHEMEEYQKEFPNLRIEYKAEEN
ncbi:hypothetical protein [Roseivirga misakiensis]|uniref:Leucine-rich repeat domain-containing protein n=1 Tax=Roseivirga misakiensis TaxID=1563681 RepID=A0A1E5T5L4_9BACT|nr:hypothetical protein [Roseivirga misakiensis]OEK06597.1 hypothetical protein BFP71_02700 [Roseivirga misakiensis]